jgi:hypothetical protein
MVSVLSHYYFLIFKLNTQGYKTKEKIRSEGENKREGGKTDS